MPTYKQVNNITALFYKALINQDAPVASQTSGTVPVGSIWTINSIPMTINITLDSGVFFEGHHIYATGGPGGGADILSIVDNGASNYDLVLYNISGTWAGNPTFNGDYGQAGTINSISVDDFSNWNLISGSENSTNAVYQATSAAPAVWTFGSSISYDGAPYVVSVNSDGDIAPFTDTVGSTSMIRNALGAYTISFGMTININSLFIHNGISWDASASRILIPTFDGGVRTGYIMLSSNNVSVINGEGTISGLNINSVDASFAPIEMGSLVKKFPISFEIY